MRSESCLGERARAQHRYRRNRAQLHARAASDESCGDRDRRAGRRSALKRYIRDPSSLRHWSKMEMKGFDKEALSDREIDLIIAYLRQMAGRKVPGK